VLRNSLFRSAYELLYTPLAPERKRPAKALLDVGADRVGTIAGSVVVMLVLLLPAARATGTLLALACGLAAATLMLTRRLQKGYVRALADSLHTGTVRLDAIDVVDQTTRAALAGAEAAVPARARPADEAVPSWLDAAAHLRSRDPARVRAVLDGEASLPPQLISLVVPLLADDELFTEAVRALRRAGGRCTGQLVDVLLDREEDPIVRRRVPRVLKAVPSQRAVDGLLTALRDERFDVRYRSAQALVRLHQRDASLTIPSAEVFAVAQRELAAGRSSPRGLEHVFGLLSLSLPGEPLAVALRAWHSGDPMLRGTALEYLENVLPAAVWASLWPWLGARASATGRTLDEIRDDLLRSTASLEVRRRSRKTATGEGR
jgi:HEAT repeat protein